MVLLENQEQLDFTEGHYIVLKRKHITFLQKNFRYCGMVFPGWSCFFLKRRFLLPEVFQDIDVKKNAGCFTVEVPVKISCI